MTTHDEGLAGEHDVEVPYAASGCAPPRPPLADCVRDVLEPEVVVRRTARGRYLIHGRVEVEITLHRHRPARGLPLWTASAVLETPSGPMQWAASATEHEVAQQLAREQGIAGVDLSNLGRDLGRLFGGAQGSSNQRRAQRGAQSLAFQRVVRDVRRTLDSPAGRAVTNVLSQVPYIGPAVQGVRAATTLVDNVARGNPRSRQNLARLQRAARGGDPRARRAVNVVESVLRAQRRIAVARATGPARSERRRSPDEERAWSEADRRWNAYRAARARAGLSTRDPLITPPPRR